MKNLNMERIRLITMAYGSHLLNYCSVDRIDTLPLKVLKTLTLDDLINLRRQVLDCPIPEHYVFQIKTQGQVVEKIEKAMKSALRTNFELKNNRTFSQNEAGDL